MVESMASRVARLISGGFHSLINALEDAAPEAAMAQAIREVDEAIDEVRAELGVVAANKHLASTRLMEENRKHDELGEQLALAIKQGRDDLASAAVERQLDIEAQIPILENSVADCQSRQQELEGYILALQAKHREMQDTLRQYIESRKSTVTAAAPGAAGKDSQRKLEQAQAAFDRILQRQTGVGGPGAAPDQASAAKLSELNDLARKHRIQERLAAVKAKLDE